MSFQDPRPQSQGVIGATRLAGERGPLMSRAYGAALVTFGVVDELLQAKGVAACSF